MTMKWFVTVDSDSEVGWAKSAPGPWRIGSTFGGELYFTWITEEGRIPKKLLARTVPEHGKQPAESLL